VKLSKIKTFTPISMYVMVAQLGDVTAMYSSNLLIAHRFGPSTVPKYAIAYSLYMTAINMFHGVWAPFWPAYTEALSRRDLTWIRQTLSRNTKLCLAGMSGDGLAMIAIGPNVIKLWVGEPAVPQRRLLFAMSLYFVLLAISSLGTTTAYGLGLFRVKSASAVLSAAVLILGALLLFPTHGLLALPLAGVAGCVLEISLIAPAVIAVLRNTSSNPAC